MLVAKVELHLYRSVCINIYAQQGETRKLGHIASK